ncbi:MAG: S41 family peptidase [Rudaea sp.]|uniref:S41 family peptidase n=1 Tax=Rudaea sp. TaxID=2136325 RepID=UPI0039E60634
MIETLEEKLKANYIFADVADRVAKRISAKLVGGAYDSDRTVGDFAGALTRDLREVGDDKHFRVGYQPDFKERPRDGKPPSKDELEQMKRDTVQHGAGIAKVEWLSGNVGYLDLRGFAPADFVASAYASAMNLLADTDALIVDLRRNGGGDPSAVAVFMSHFFAEDDSRHLNDLRWRAENRTQEFWTVPVQGARYTKPVYVLISPRTFSGGEECAYDFQTQKRATLIGETTGGGANPGDRFALGHGLVAFIPTGQAINPITNKNWEHVGVKPDVAVPPADALKTAYATILETQIAAEKDARRLQMLKDTLARVEKNEEEKPDFMPPRH